MDTCESGVELTEGLSSMTLETINTLGKIATAAKGSTRHRSKPLAQSKLFLTPSCLGLLHKRMEMLEEAAAKAKLKLRKLIDSELELLAKSPHLITARVGCRRKLGQDLVESYDKLRHESKEPPTMIGLRRSRNLPSRRQSLVKEVEGFKRSDALSGSTQRDGKKNGVAMERKEPQPRELHEVVEDKQKSASPMVGSSQRPTNSSSTDTKRINMVNLSNATTKIKEKGDNLSLGDAVSGTSSKRI